MGELHTTVGGRGGAIVKEFYANAKEASGHVVQVRGNSVSFDKANINAYYHIRDMEDEGEFTKYRDEDFDRNQVLKCLCRPGVIWTLKGNNVLHFSPSELSRYGKAWYSFICAKIFANYIGY